VVQSAHEHEPKKHSRILLAAFAVVATLVTYATAYLSLSDHRNVMRRRIETDPTSGNATEIEERAHLRLFAQRSLVPLFRPAGSIESLLRREPVLVRQEDQFKHLGD
jgi:hypothetical protein